MSSAMHSLSSSLQHSTIKHADDTMDEKETPPAGLFAALPVEIVRVILAAVDDIESLRSVVLSCSLLRQAFFGDEKPITTSVLRRQIGSDILPEALATNASAQLNVHDTTPETREASRQAIVDFVEQNLQTRKAAPKSLSLNLREAWPLARLHTVVESFARRFAAEALATETLAPTKPATASQQEVARIQRALYRFEMYCNLFRRSSVDGIASSVDDEQATLFMDRFAYCGNRAARVHPRLSVSCRGAGIRRRGRARRVLGLATCLLRRRRR